ncbi:uncharacterized protein LOC102702271 [Oryza brachyantha]|uniref:uncharacterized protein LOC102702271 n=1 Tax=Oryza brachyantha TaxID=4533 RepID=UPI0003EA8E64|nr:uncharacterized protein LOC102702271 [Oryza brachyantha]
MAFLEPQRKRRATIKTSKITARFRPIMPRPMLASDVEDEDVLSLQSRRFHGCKRGALQGLMPIVDKRQMRESSSSSFTPPLGHHPTTIGVQCIPVGFSRSDHLGKSLIGSHISPWANWPPQVVEKRFPMECDLLRKLEEPRVTMPRPMRPLRTTICIDTSSIEGANWEKMPVCRMTALQVEAELEADIIPAIVSGPNNHVCLVNDAYKALVGQPVCPWLDSLPCTGTSRRINGEVYLDVRRYTATDQPIREAAGGAFSCNSRISWEHNGKLASVAASCDVMRLACNYREYLFVWRFDTTKGTIFYSPM